MPTYLSPNSADDVADWINEAKAIDGNTADGATMTLLDGDESPELIFNITDGCYADKVRIFFKSSDEDVLISLWVEISSSWVAVGVYREVTLDAWTVYSMSAAAVITRIKMTAINDNGLDYDIELCEIEYERIVPAKAGSPDPAHNATGVAITKTLGWANGTGTTENDVYFDEGDVAPSTKVIDDTLTVSYDPPGNLENGQIYSWRVDTKNAEGTTTGDIWKFTTIVAVPEKASVPTPIDTAVDVAFADPANLEWTNGDRTTGVDVYLVDDITYVGQLNNFVPGDKVVDNENVATYDPVTLAAETLYRWRVDCKNAGGTTTGDVWSFTTGAAAAGGGFMGKFGFW